MEEKLYNNAIVKDYYCGEETQSDEQALLETLEELFRHIRKDSGFLEASCEKGREMLTRSFYDYFDRISLGSEEERRRKAMNWLCHTHDKILLSREIILDPTVYCNNIFEIKCCSSFLL